MSDDFSKAAATFPDPFRLLIRDEVESTNDEARKLGQSGAAGGIVVITHRQTAGRGRRGAAWFSPPGESLAFTILIRPDEPQALWPRLALATGLAVAEAVESYGISAGIKWPNDVWIHDRKVAGILVEADRDFAVVGIGLNVNTRGFPPGISEIATSLHIETGGELPRHEVLGRIIQRFAIRQKQIGVEFNELLESVRHRCVLTGKQVSLTTSGMPKEGIIEGIAPGGELVLRGSRGLEHLIQADEVRILG